LYLLGKRTAIVKLENGRQIFLADTLLVPDLGCSLLSAKKLLGIDLIGQFDPYRMIFIKRENGKHLVEAESRKGLYIVSKISSEANGKTFGQKSSDQGTLQQDIAPLKTVEIKAFPAQTYLDDQHTTLLYQYNKGGSSQTTLDKLKRSVKFAQFVIEIPTNVFYKD